MSTSQFVFASCQPGAEGSLKKEIAARLDGWKFSFSRPGFVTFKLPLAMTIERFEPARLTFARTLGLSFDRFEFDPTEGYNAVADWLLNQPIVAALSPDRAPIWHVWQRDSLLPGDDGIEPGATDATCQLQQALEQKWQVRKQETASTEQEASEGRPKPVVFDAILVEPTQCWLGAHAVRSRPDRWPGGVPPLELPEHAISRAYLKMQEGLRWSAFPARPGEEWVELGCAPGGATQALLDQGMFVTGIDPAEVDPNVVAHPKFRHLQMRTAETPRSEIAGAQWLAADVNAAPKYTLDGVESILGHSTVHLRGLLLTIKLLSSKLADPEQIAEVVARIQSWGFTDVRVRQLAHNRREYCVAALRSRGQRRMQRRR